MRPRWCSPGRDCIGRVREDGTKDRDGDEKVERDQTRARMALGTSSVTQG